MSGEPSSSAAAEPYRICGCCHKRWATWRDFVVDPQIRLLGLQMVPNLPDGNLLVFDHGCGTSISMFARRLRPLIPGLDNEPAPAAGLGSGECERQCPELEDLVVCKRPCARARDRRLVEVILELKQR